jgi:glyoxylase-like metal-dependent hydrolase (beta-lactamase superfamily II)
MTLLSNTGGVASTNCFLLADESTGDAVLFDAPDHTVMPLLDEAARHKWNLRGLWLTHGHFDHFADHAVVRSKFPNVRVLIHKLDEPKAKAPDAQTRLFGLPMQIPPLNADAYVEENQTLRIGGIEVKVIYTPGHAPGHVSYHLPNEKILIGGDLIIGGSVGRTDLPDSNHAQLQESIRRVMKLPHETRLLGGHGEESTLADEMQNNYFVQEAIK